MTEPVPAPKAGPKRERHRSGNPQYQRVSANAQALADRRLKALDLRIQGKTYNDIAKALGVGYKTAWDDVHHSLIVREAELVPKLRAIEEERLDRVIAECFDIMQARKGTEMALKAADRILRAVHTRAGLLGLNAPLEVNVTEQTQLDQEISALIKQQEALNQVTRAQIIEGQAIEGGITTE